MSSLCFDADTFSDVHAFIIWMPCCARRSLTAWTTADSSASGGFASLGPGGWASVSPLQPERGGAAARGSHTSQRRSLGIMSSDRIRLCSEAEVQANEEV